MSEHQCPTCGMNYVCGDPTCRLAFKEVHHKKVEQTVFGCTLIKQIMEQTSIK